MNAHFQNDGATSRKDHLAAVTLGGQRHTNIAGHRLNDYSDDVMHGLLAAPYSDCLPITHDPVV